MELFRAVKRGDLVKTKSLLESRSGDEKTDLINSLDQSGMALLHVASQRGNLELVKYLIDLGAEVSKPGDKGYTALHFACRKGHIHVAKCLIKKGADIDTGTESPLVVASREGHFEVVEYLLNTGADVNKRAKDGISPLYVSSYKGHLDIVKCLVTTGGELDLSNDYGITPLYTASLNGQYDVVKYLVNAGAEVNKAKPYGDTPVYAASREGHFDIVQYLVNAGADTNKATDNGDTPLYTASHRGHHDIVKYLITKGADPDKADREGQTPLYIASQKGHLDVVQSLVNAGADVNKAPNDGNTPLLAALRADNLDIAKYLITTEADPNMADSAGQTPVYIASQRGHLDILESLVNAGADVSKASKDGDTPLLAASSNGNFGIVKYLKTKRAVTNMCERASQTPLYIASQKGHHDIAKYLITRGADPAKADRAGQTPLYIASQKGYLGVVEPIVNAGADVNKASNDGNTPLLAALRKGHLDIAKYLITTGADSNMADSAGQTPLYIASQKGYLDILESLVDAGADVNKASKDGDTPLLAASSNGHFGIVKYLISKGASLDFANNKDETSFSLALKEGHLGIAECLLIAGADVKRSSTGSKASLHAASRHGYINVVKYLIPVSSGVGVRDRFGFTPLHYSVQDGHLLVDAGADVNTASCSGNSKSQFAAERATADILNANGFTPLHLASQAGHLDIVEYLVQAGADVNKASSYDNAPQGTSHVRHSGHYGTEPAKANKGITPLHLASEASHLNIVEFLVNAGADVNKASNEGDTPLLAALREGNHDIAKYLITKRANHNVADRAGQTPLYIASTKGYLGVVESLVNAGPDVNKASHDGDTPLLAASSNGHLGIVKYLISKGASLDLTNNEGETSFSMALRKGKLGIAEYLMSAGADVNKEHLFSRASLHDASRLGYINVVKYTIPISSDLDVRDFAGFTPLHYAAQNGHLDIVKCLLDAGGDVNTASSRPTKSQFGAKRAKADIRNAIGFTPLHLASHGGHLNIVEYLVQAGADVNKVSVSDNVPQHTTSHKRYSGHYGTDPAEANIEGITPLHLASQAGHLSIVKYLVQAGAHVNKASGSANTPRDTGGYFGHFGTQRAGVERVSIKGITPLHLASQAGDLSIVEYLVQEGADVNQTSVDGITPLHAALNACLVDKSYLRRNLQGLDFGMTEYVIGIPSFHAALAEEEYGAGEPFAYSERDADKASSTTQLHYPSNKSYLDIARYLVTKGAEVDKNNRFGVTLLQLASHAGHLGALECLVNAGADVNKAAKHDDMSLYLQPRRRRYPMLEPEDDYAHKPPLYIASEEGHLGIVQCLLKSGADVNMPIGNGNTPLHAASNEGHFDVVKYLTARGANLSACNIDGLTPIHAASLKGNLKIVEYLVEAGANVDTVSSLGEGPLQAASRMGHHEVVQYLSKVSKNRSSPTEKTGFQHSPSHFVIDPGASLKRKNKSATGKSRKGKSIKRRKFNVQECKRALPDARQVIIDEEEDFPSTSRPSLEVFAEKRYWDESGGRIKTSAPISPSVRHERENCSVKGVFTSKGGELSIPSHGFNLFIPPGALESSQEISLQPVFDLPSGIDFKQDEIVASLGFRCQPSGIIFKRPVKLTIPHCALISDPERVKCILYTERKDGGYVRSVAREFIPHHGKMNIFLDHFCDVHPVLEGDGVLGKVMLCTPFLPKARLEKQKDAIVHLDFYNDNEEVKKIVSKEEDLLQYSQAFPVQELIINKDPHTTVVQCTVLNSAFNEEKKVPNKTLLQHRWHTVCCYPKLPECDSIIVINLQPHDKEMGFSTEKPLALMSPTSSIPHSTTTTAGNGSSSADAQEVTDAHVTSLLDILRSDHFSAMYTALGITHADAENIRVEKRDNYPAIYKALLQKWRDRSEVTLKDLDEVLRKAGLGGLVSKYKQI